MRERPGHVLLTRPRPESEALAALLDPLGLEPVILPAFDYLGQELPVSQPEDFASLSQATEADLIVFTSPRAVQFGLPQLPAPAHGLLDARPPTAVPVHSGDLALTIGFGAGLVYAANVIRVP